MTTDDRLADLRVALTLIANECVPPTDQHTIARIQSLAHNALAAGVRVAPSPDALREAAENLTDRRTLMDDGFWVSQKEMRALDEALGRAREYAALATEEKP